MNKKRILVYVVLVLSMLLGLCSCSTSPEPNNQIFKPTADNIEVNRKEGISISLSIEEYKGLSLKNSTIIECTDVLADEIDANYSDYLGENKVDRAQLYGEIMLHINAWDANMFEGNTKEINLNIYSDGSVKDHRPIINFLASLLGKGYK